MSLCQLFLPRFMWGSGDSSIISNFQAEFIYYSLSILVYHVLCGVVGSPASLVIFKLNSFIKTFFLHLVDIKK